MKNRGFTLVELVISIALLSIVATVSVLFVKTSATGLLSSAARQQLAASGYIVSEQVSRAIRNALPGSIRVTSDETCVEYIPILAASRYTNISIGASTLSFDAFPYSTTTSVAGYVAIYPVSGSLYSQTDPGPLTPDTTNLPAASTEVTINLASSHTFPTDSPERRFFMVSQPEAICQNGAYLYRYSNYGFVENISDLKTSLPADYASGRAVLAHPLELNSMSFRYSPSSLRRNGLVAFEYLMEHPTTGDTQFIGQQVRVNNVP